MDWDIYVLIQQFKANKELRTFRKWLRHQSNQATNTNEKLLNLLVEQEHTQVTEQELWRAFQGDKPFKAATFRKYRHDLKAKCLDFIADQELKVNARVKNQLLAEGLMERNLSGLLNRHLRHCLEQPLDLDYANSEELYGRAVLQNMTYSHAVQQGKPNTYSLTEVWECYDQAWLLESLRLTCLWHSRKEVLGQDSLHQPFFLPFIEYFLASHPPQPEEGLLFAYATLWNLFTGKTTDPEPFFDWLNGLESPSRDSTLLDVFWLFHNYLARQGNSGNFSYWGNYLLESYLWGIEHKFLYQERYILPAAYRNLIITAMRCARPDLAWNYLEAFQKDLPPNDPAQSARYCKGYYYYRQKQYRKMRQVWKSYFPKPIILEVGVRLLKLQARYEEFVLWQMPDELGEIEEDFPVLERLVSETKGLSDTHKAQYAYRFAYFRRLLDLDVKDIESVSTFAQELATDQTLDNQAWFVEQLTVWQDRLDIKT